jgi:hypothetical protein
MKHLFTPLLACFGCASALGSIEAHVQEVMSEVRTLRPMKQSERYTLQAGGEALTGLSDDFLRRRSADEINASGLSCGCGDYAILFLDLMTRRGFEALLVDSAEISSRSLQSRYAGHAVVAVRGTVDRNSKWSWWLVDPTNRSVLSRDWSLSEKSFNAGGHVYWIGYCGVLEKYPAKSPEELRRFYTDTLAKVPREFFNRTLYRFRYIVDDSLRDADGRLLNARIQPFLTSQSKLFSSYGIEPDRTIIIRLVRGDDSASSNLRHSDAEGWVSRVGLKSACSASFVTYLEATVRRHLQREAGRSASAP